MEATTARRCPSRERYSPLCHDSVYRSSVKLKEGRIALVIDTGSRGNLCSDSWGQAMERACNAYGPQVERTKRLRPLTVTGVGKQDQVCDEDWKFPIAMPLEEGRVMPCSYISPVIKDSGIPALLGLNTLKTMGAVIDCKTFKIYLPGPEGHKHLPCEGTKVLQAECSESGHMLVPCDEFARLLAQPREAEPAKVVSLTSNTH